MRLVRVLPRGTCESEAAYGAYLVVVLSCTNHTRCFIGLHLLSEISDRAVFTATETKACHTGQSCYAVH